MSKWRKVFRLTGLILPVIYLYSKPHFLWFTGVGSLLFLLFEFLRRRFHRLTQRYLLYFKPIAKEREKHNPLGISYLFWGAFLTGVIFSREAVLAALTFLIIGDISASIVDRHFGKIVLPWSKKSLEGRLAYFTSCLLAAIIMKSLGLSLPWFSLWLAGLIATLVEAAPLRIGNWWLDDNLTIGLSVGFVLSIA